MGNQIPEWNNLTTIEDHKKAWDRLQETNNFPEVTGRVCPAPCEDVCTLGIGNKPVSIRGVEHSLAELAFENGWVKPLISKTKLNKSIAVIGSGPAGLAAAQQLVRKRISSNSFQERQDPRWASYLRYSCI